MEPEGLVGKVKDEEEGRHGECGEDGPLRGRHGVHRDGPPEAHLTANLIPQCASVSSPDLSTLTAPLCRCWLGLNSRPLGVCPSVAHATRKPRAMRSLSFKRCQALPGGRIVVFVLRLSSCKQQMKSELTHAAIQTSLS
jgi:hypothetical protein